MEHKFFEPPTVEIIEIEVEQGFAQTPTGSKFNVDDLSDGGTI